MSQEQC